MSCETGRQLHLVLVLVPDSEDQAGVPEITALLEQQEFHVVVLLVGHFALARVDEVDRRGHLIQVKDRLVWVHMHVL